MHPGPCRASVGCVTRRSTRESSPQPAMPRLKSLATWGQFSAPSWACRRSSSGPRRLPPVASLTCSHDSSLAFMSDGIIMPLLPPPDWNETSYGTPTPFERGQSGNILPIVFQHLCPLYVAVVGIGALAAAVMSSVDSVLLSAASQLGRNVFRNIFYKQVCLHIGRRRSTVHEATLTSGLKLVHP